MLSLINTLLSAALLTASSLSNPTLPGEHRVEASAFVTINNQIRVSVVKPAAEKVTVLLKDKQNHVLYQQQLAKGAQTSAILFTVNELTDGAYQIEVRSQAGSLVKQVNLSTSQPQPSRQIVVQ